MIPAIRKNKTYYFKGAMCWVVERIQNHWMPDQVKIRRSNGEFETVLAKTFRNDAQDM